MTVIDWDDMLEAFAERMRMALAEAGYPDADVYPLGTGVFVEGVPSDVTARAFEVCNV